MLRVPRRSWWSAVYKGRQSYVQPKRPLLYVRSYTQLHPLLEEKALQLQKEYKELSKEVSSGEGYSSTKAVRLGKLESIVQEFEEYQSLKAELPELQAMLSDATLKVDAELELAKSDTRLTELSQRLQTSLVPSNPFVDKACILELRPGIGGQEAMIFANDLLNMYQNYALKKKWKSQVVSITPVPGSSGIMEAILSINEPGSYEKLQYEGGVHRVQRVPETETKGRVHTSTAAVVVLPQLSERTVGNDSETGDDSDERSFEPGEVRIEVMRARGAGGQHVNRTESAVRLTHIPTGIQVAMQDERSQHKNKAKAFMILRARIAEKERVEREKEERSKRTAQVSSTERSDKIRTYNYPQNRITDHRCGYSGHNLTETMAGEALDLAIEAMDKYRKEEILREMIGGGT